MKNTKAKQPSATAAVAICRPRVGLALLVLGLLLLCAYSTSFQGPFIFDDASSITENTSVRSLGTALFPPGKSGLTVSGRPVLNLSLAVNFALGGENVVGYHAVNFAIHVLAVFFLFGLLRLILELPSIPGTIRDQSFWLALAVAAVWGLHPLQTESVTYVIQRAESLVSLFYLATFYFFVRFVGAPLQTRWLWAAVAACWLGMGSKEVMVSAPLMIFLFDRVYVAGSFRAAWQARRGLYVGLGASWLLLALCVASTGGRGATAGFETDVGVWEYALTQCYAITRYLGLVFWPSPLVLDYGSGLASGFVEVWAYVFFMVALVWATITVWVRWPKAGFPAVVFFAVLAPSSSVVPVATQTIAEHRMYLALALVVIILVVGLYWFGRKQGLIICGALALVLGLVTFNRNGDYRSALSIWAHNVEHRPQNFRSHFSYGMALADAGRYRDALDSFETALEMNPKDRGLMIRYADALHKVGETTKALGLLERALTDIDAERVPEAYEGYNNLGVLLGAVGKREEGMQALRTAIALKPKRESAHFNLGNALTAIGRHDEAAKEFYLALDSKWDDVKTRTNLGYTLLQLGRFDEAIVVVGQGLKKNGNPPELLSALGAALLHAGRMAEAKQRFDEALAIDPKFGPAHAKLGLICSAARDEAGALKHFEAAIAAGDKDPVLLAVSGRSLLAQGRTEEGLARLEAAVAVAPNDFQLRYTLAASLLGCGRAASAAKIYETLIAQNPGPYQLHNDLGLAYQKMGRLREARAQFERALEIAPGNESVLKNIAGLNP